MDTNTTSTELSLQEIKERYHRYLGGLTREAMAQKARAGGCAGCAPTGYRNVKVGKETEVAIDPVLGPLVAEAFQLATRSRSSLRQVLAELGPKGLVSRNGKAMNASALRGILTNPFYVGMIRYQKHLYEGTHEPLISPSLFERVQRSLKRRRH